MSRFSNFNLEMMNLIIGMCKGVAGLPRHFFELGYSNRAIEFKFANSDGKTVVPELIIASQTLRHAVLFEWKSGKNTEAEQLRRYSGVTREDLHERVYLLPSESESHDIAIVGIDSYRESIIKTIERDGYSFPVLLAVPEGVEIIRNKFRANDLDRAFRPRLNLSWENVPRAFFPVDKESDLWEFAELIIPEIVGSMTQGESRILFTRLASKAFPLWDDVDAHYQKELRLKILQVMDRASRGEFRRYLRRNKPIESRTHTPTWDITSNPFIGHDRAMRTEQRRMLKLQSSFIESLKDGSGSPYQENLFQE